MSETLLIRADASPRMGTGHVMRCLALAQGWQRHGGKVHFLQAETTPALEHRLNDDGVKLSRLNVQPGGFEDAEQTIAQAGEHSASWVVADGYHFAANYQRAIKDAGLRLLFVDDYGHAQFYCADAVLDQNLGADASLYQRREPHTRLLLGTRYALLRKEFRPWQNWTRKISPVLRRVLVTLGGSDPDNVTGKVVRALAQISGVEALVVIGGSNFHRAALETAIAGLDPAIRAVVDTPNLADLMAWADVAVAAGGSTSWELAFMGLPSLVLVLAENQLGIAVATDREGVTVNLGEHARVSVEHLGAALRSLLSDSRRWQQMSERGQELVDGFGTDRVVQFLAEDKPRQEMSVGDRPSISDPMTR